MDGKYCLLEKDVQRNSAHHLQETTPSSTANLLLLFFILLWILGFGDTCAATQKARLTLWQAHSNPLWHCERSAPGQLHSTPTGIQNQSPHGSLTNHPSIPRPVICTNMEHQTRGIRTGLNIGPVLQRWRLSPCTQGWPFSAAWLKRAVVVVVLVRPVHQHKVIHPGEMQCLLLLIHLRRFTGLWYWSVNQACAQEFHSPHQATVRRH